MSGFACSIVIPSRNRRQHLERLLEALASQTLAQDRFETIVILDGPTDDSDALLERWTGSGRLAHLRWMSQPWAGQAAARTAGARHAQAPVLVFLDDDVVPEPGCLAAHLRWYEDGARVAVLGRAPIVLPSHPSFYDLAVRAWWGAFYQQQAQRGTALGYRDFCATNVSVRRDDFFRVGGFDPAFRGYGGEDYDLGYRLLRDRVRFIADPQAAAHHHHAGSPAQLLRNMQDEGQQEVLLGRKHPALRQDLRLMTRTRFAQVIFEHPRVCAVAAAIGRRLLPLCQRLRWQGGWQWLFRKLRHHSFWRGVREALGSWEALNEFLGNAPTNPHVFIMFRNDDPCALSNPAHERRVLELFERYGLPQVVAVIPHVVDDPHDDRLTTYHPLHENPAMVDLLRDYHTKGLIEIAQHGFTHQTNVFRPSRVYDSRPYRGIDKMWLPYDCAHPEDYSEFNGLPLETQRDKVMRGKQYLEAIFGTPIETFVFPWNSLNRPCLEVLRETGVHYVPCEEDKHIVPGLHIIGCCFWEIDEYLEQIREALFCGKPTLLHLSFHSWMLTSQQLCTLEQVLRYVAQEPRIRCITPRQIPEVIAGATTVLPLRAQATQLSAQVNQYLQTPHRDAKAYYIVDKGYYWKRFVRLRIGLFILKYLGIARTLLWASAIFSTALVYALRRGQMGAFELGILGLSGAMGLGAWCLRQREQRLLGVRGLIRRCLDATRAWVEFATLLVRCSPLESVRERTVRHLRTNWRKPIENGRPSVCIIAENAGWGGTEVHTRLLIEQLIARGYRVEYVSGRTNDFDQRLEACDSARVRILKSPLSIFDQGKEAYQQWLRQLEQLHSRTLLLPVPFSHFGSFAFLRACRRAFERIVYIQHTLPDPMPVMTRKRHLGGRIAGLGMAWYKERLRRIYRMRCAHRIVAVSDEVREQSITHWACAPEKVLTIRNGIDWRKFQVAEPDRETARRMYHLLSDSMVFGMLTRLSEEKGVDLAIEAFRRLLATKPARPAYLVIAGEGPDAQAIKALAARKELAGRVIFTGFVNRPLEVLSLMDVIVFSSRAEGLPLALLEGMAAGAIPLVVRVGGMPEVINDPELGWVVEPGDIAGFAEAMAQVLTLDVAAIRRRREQMLSRIKASFDAQVNYQAVLKAAGIKWSPPECAGNSELTVRFSAR